MTKVKENVLPPIILSEPQTDVFNARSAMVLDMAGQGSGKTENIGLISGYKIINYPELKGFIGANTHNQLSQSTLTKVFKVWEKYYGLYQYNPKTNPNGAYVVDKKPPEHFKVTEQFKDYHNIISFVNGVIVFVGSLENYLAHDGKEFAWAHLDETKDTKEAALTDVILSRLRQMGLYYKKNDPKQLVYDLNIKSNEADELGLISFQPIYVHTSPSSGGVEWLLKLFKIDKKEKIIKQTILDENKYYYEADHDICVVIYQTFWNAENLPNNYISKQWSRMVENERLKFIYGYPFSKNGGEYFPSFERTKHVKKLEFDRSKTFHLGFDFNVVPYMTELLVNIDIETRYYNYELEQKSFVPKKGFQPIDVMVIRFIKEYCLKSPNNSVKGVCQTFLEDIRNLDGTLPQTNCFVYGDATGRGRIVGLGDINQYDLIENELFEILDSDYMRVPKANVRQLTRRDICEEVFKGLVPTLEVEINETCTELIRDFEYLKEGPDGKLKEKTTDPKTKVRFENIGHTSDVAEYIITYIYKQYVRD